jgi:copper(I)-binding protein
MKMLKLFAASLLASAALLAQSVTVSGEYVREVPPNMPNSAAFMVLKNDSDATVSLVSAASDAAATVELHEHASVGGMMQMRQIPKIDVPAHGTTSLQPGGLHVMLIGLTHKLKAGEEVAITLTFSNGETIALKAPVKKVPGMMMHKGMSGSGKCGKGKCGN